MDNEEYVELLNEINDIISSNDEMKIRIYFNILLNYMNMKLSKEEKETIVFISKKQLTLINKENQVLDYLARNLQYIADYEKVGTLLDEIDYIAECNYDAYEDPSSIITMDEDFSKKYDRITRMIGDSLLSYDAVLLFLKENGYKDRKFFKYIKKRIRHTIDKDFYGCYPIYKNEILVDFYMYIPEVTNLHTYLINLHEHYHAYELYKKLNSKEIINIKKSEKEAKMFEKKYLKKRFDLSTY